MGRSSDAGDRLGRGMRSAQVGLLANVTLVVAKLFAGVLGNTYALIADAVESSTDIFSSLIVWGALSISARPPDEDHPFGHGKAEPIASAVVSLLLLGAAGGIAVAAVREIRTPHHLPAAWTLAVAAVVFAVKEALFRRVAKVGAEVGGTAVTADAWHHRADALSSAAVFVGIAIAVWGGPGWESADDWAALVAAAVVAFNGAHLLRPAVHALMDRAPDSAVIERVAAAAAGVPGVRAIEKLKVRTVGLDYYVDLHVQADPTLSLHDAHILSGKVKRAIRDAVPPVTSALIHMEPYEDATAAAPPAAGDGR